MSSVSYFVWQICECQESGNNIAKDIKDLIFSPFANPDDSNFSSFMSATNDVDLDFIGESRGDTETRRGLITCQVSLSVHAADAAPVHVGVDGVEAVVVVPGHGVISSRQQPVDD